MDVAKFKNKYRGNPRACQGGIALRCGDDVADAGRYATPGRGLYRIHTCQAITRKATGYFLEICTLKKLVLDIGVWHFPFNKAKYYYGKKQKSTT